MTPLIIQKQRQNENNKYLDNYLSLFHLDKGDKNIFFRNILHL